MSLLLAAPVAAIYAPTLRHDFLDWDDNETVQHNPDFDPNNAHADYTHYWFKPYLELYMPLTYMAWGTTAQISQTRNPSGGGNVLVPAGFHVLSVALHCINGVLVFLVLRRLIARAWAAWLGAAVFALHPFQVESVAWITSTSILLSSAFSLWAMWHYLRFDELRNNEGQTRPRKAAAISHPAAAWTHYTVGTAAFVLALLSKPSVVVVPLMLAAIIIGLRQRRLLHTWPLAVWLVLSIPLIVVTRAAQSGWAIHVPLLRRPAVALDGLGFYFWKMIWPLRLIPDYGRTPVWLFSHAQYWTILIPLGLAAVALLLWKRSRCPAVLLVIFVLALLPVLGLTPFSYQRYSTVADRYVYLAMLAPALGLAAILSVRFNRISLTASVIIVLLLGLLTFLQQRYWRDTPTLFRHTLAVNPDSLAANFVLGDWYAKQADWARAIEYDQAALKTHPTDGRVFYSLGNALYNAGRYEQAIEAYRRSLQPPAAPDSSSVYIDDALPSELRAKTCDNMGVAYIHTSRLDDAIKAFEQAKQIDPNYETAAKHLAVARMLRSRRGK
jgi:tetratricopeptide (TPR) repeat protein